MTSPLSDSTSEPVVLPNRADRRKIARKWAYQIGLTTYVPLPHADIEGELLELVDHIFDAMTCEPLPTDRVAAVAARLVDLHCVGTASVRTTVEVLAGALLSAPELRAQDRMSERVVQLLGALTSGYVEAIRSSTMGQQDNLHRALLEALWLSERKLATSEARLGEVLACSSSGVAITDLDGTFVRVNAALRRTLDLMAGPLDDGGRPTLFDLIRPGSVDVCRAYRALHDGKPERLTLGLDLPTADGQTLPASLTASVLRDADGTPSGYVTTIVIQ